MKTNLLKKLSLGVSIVMLLPMLAACGNTTTAKATKSKSLSPVTLQFFIPGDDKSGKAEVLTALAAKVKDRLNAKFIFNFVPFGDYQNKLTMMAASGDNYDAAFTADWMGYSDMVNKGAFLDLTTLLPKYAPNLYKTYKDNNMLADASVNGKVLALPWTQIKTSKPVFQYRQDIVDKLGVKPGNLTTIEGIDTFLTAIAKAKPGMTTFDMNISGAGMMGDIEALLAAKYEYQDLGFHSLFMNMNDSTHKVVTLEQTPMFKDAVTYAKKWYNSGVISKDAMTVVSANNYPNGTVFSGKSTSGSLFEKTNFTDPKAVNKAVEVYPGNKFPRDSQMNNALAINVNAANPERTLMFMNLVSTDQSVYDALMYGIKGKTYTLDANNVIGFAPGDNAANPLWQNWGDYAFLRQNLDRPTATRSAEAAKNELAYATRSNIPVSVLSGFTPVPDVIKTQLAQRDQIQDNQGKLLLSGVAKGDITTEINSYITLQKTAGTDKILQEVQRQVDAFLKK